MSVTRIDFNFSYSNENGEYYYEAEIGKPFNNGSLLGTPTVIDIINVSSHYEQLAFEIRLDNNTKQTVFNINRIYEKTNK